MHIHAIDVLIAVFFILAVRHIWRGPRWEELSWAEFLIQRGEEFPTLSQAIAAFLSQKNGGKVAPESPYVDSFAKEKGVDVSFEAEFRRFRRFYGRVDFHCPWTLRETLEAFLRVRTGVESVSDGMIGAAASTYGIKIGDQ